MRTGGRKNRETELCFCLPLTLLVQWQPETGYPDGVWFPNWLAGLSLLVGFVLRIFPTPLWNYHCRDIPGVNMRVWCAMPMPANLVVSDWGRPWRGATTTGAAHATTFFGKSWQSAAAVMPGQRSVTLTLSWWTSLQRWRIRQLLLCFEFATCLNDNLSVFLPHWCSDFLI